MDRRVRVKYLESINKQQFLQGWMYRLNTYFPPISGAAVGLGIGAAALLIAALLFLKK